MEGLKIIVRHPDRATIYRGLPDAKASSDFDSVAANKLEFSPDGRRFAALTIEGITIYDCASEQQVGTLDVKNVIAVAWSPKGGLMQTFERPSKELGNQHKNLKLWDLATGEVLMQLFQKAWSREAWPAIQLSADEDLAFHGQANAVNVYNPRDFPAGVLRKLHLKGLGGFAVSPGGGPHLAAFVPEAKGSPGFVAVYDHTQLVKSGDAPAPICRRSFFRASNVRLVWSPAGGALLAETSSDSDASNKSYYGESKLYFLSAAGKSASDSQVALKEGPVHDFAWTPDGTAFAATAGFMPARTAIFDAQCRQIADLGAGPHNTVRFNRWGRFLALAGFGNLPGDMAFWERKPDGKWKQLTTTRATNGVSASWSPDGRHFMTATLSPRMRVDNGFYVYRHDGALVAQLPLPELLEAAWIPAPEGTFEDRPSSPRASRNEAKQAASASNIQQPAAKAAGYVPPARRAAASAQPDLHAAQERHMRASAASAAAAAGKTFVAGATVPASKAASKNAAKRRRKKAGGGGGDGADGDNDAAEADGAAQEMAQLSTAETGTPSEADDAAAAAAAPAAAAVAAPEAVDADKRLRNLQKKLRQVQQLKERVAKEGKSSLDADQQAKLASEDGLIAEIKSLGGDV